MDSLRDARSRDPDAALAVGELQSSAWLSEANRPPRPELISALIVWC
jgi:hypothetical protein